MAPLLRLSLIHISLWARFDGAANFKITPSGQGGVTLRYGFTGTHTQNVMVERIQALAVEQSILWRVFGWYRIKMTIAGIGVEPVSYTHLDVYKRQVMDSVCLQS